MAYLDDIKRLKGAQRDAAAALVGLFAEYGLESLAGRIIDMVKQGFSSDTMTIMLEKTPEYQTRFSANNTRIKNGLPKLSPREYIETERSYKAVMAQSGMPKGFYDQRSDFSKFLENDLSPNELQERVRTWQSVAQDADTGELRRLYGLGVSDYAAYLMDPKRATPLLQKQARSVQFASAAKRHGYLVDKGLAEQYGGGQYNVEAADAEKGWAAISEIQADTDRLGRMQGVGGYSAGDAAAEVFGGDATAGKKRKKIASQERATFADSGRGKAGKSGSSSSY